MFFVPCTNPQLIATLFCFVLPQTYPFTSGGFSSVQSAQTKTVTKYTCRLTGYSHKQMLWNMTVAILAISLTHSHTTIAANTKLSVITAEIGSKLAVVTAEIGSSHCWIGSSCSLQSQPHTQTYTCTHSHMQSQGQTLKIGSSIHTHKPIHALTHMQSQGQTLWKLAAVLAKSTRAYIYKYMGAHTCMQALTLLFMLARHIIVGLYSYIQHASIQ